MVIELLIFFLYVLKGFFCVNLIWIWSFMSMTVLLRSAIDFEKVSNLAKPVMDQILENDWVYLFSYVLVQFRQIK